MKSRYLEIAAWILMCAIAAVIPTVKIYSSLIIGVLGLVVLVNWKPKKKLSLVMTLLLVFYATILLGVISNDNPDLVVKSLETKLSLVVFPLIWFFAPGHEENWIKRVLGIFILATLGFELYSTGAAWANFQNTEDASVFTYRKLAAGYHPTYQAAYACFSIGILLHWVRRGVFPSLRYAAIAVAAFMSMYVAFLSSKAGILTLGGILLVMLFRFAGKKDSRKLSWMPGVVMMVFVIAIFASPNAGSRIEQAVEATLSTQEVTGSASRSSGNVRLIAWQASVQLMLENPFGVGTGDADDALQAKYIERGETFAAERRINAHNQFLQSGVAFGWWGFFLLIAICFAALLEAFRLKSPKLALLVLIVGFNMLFESFLENQAGIVFFAFFLMLLSQSYTIIPAKKKRRTF